MNKEYRMNNDYLTIKNAERRIVNEDHQQLTTNNQQPRQSLCPLRSFRENTY